MTALRTMPPPAPIAAWVLVGAPGRARPTRVEGSWDEGEFAFAWGGATDRRAAGDVWFSETAAWRALEARAEEARTAAAHAYHAADAEAQRVRRGLIDAQQRWLRGRR